MAFLLNISWQSCSLIWCTPLFNTPTHKITESLHKLLQGLTYAVFVANINNLEK